MREARTSRGSGSWPLMACPRSVHPRPLQADPRGKVVALPPPVGAGASLDFAVNEAAGRLAPSADDEVLPRVHCRRVRTMLRLTNLGWCAGWRAGPLTFTRTVRSPPVGVHAHALGRVHMKRDARWFADAWSPAHFAARHGGAEDGDAVVLNRDAGGLSCSDHHMGYHRSRDRVAPLTHALADVSGSGSTRTFPRHLRSTQRSGG